MKAMEHELQDKTKVDRGLLNSWFIEVQRTKVILIKTSISVFSFERAKSFFRRENS